MKTIQRDWVKVGYLVVMTKKTRDYYLIGSDCLGGGAFVNEWSRYDYEATVFKTRSFADTHCMMTGITGHKVKSVWVNGDKVMISTKD